MGNSSGMGQAQDYGKTEADSPKYSLSGRLGRHSLLFRGLEKSDGLEDV